MSTKSMFRLSTQSNKSKETLHDEMFPQRPPPINLNESVFSALDQSTVRSSPHFLWQSLTPELRAEALRRAHLIHLLRQVNPNLQLCRKSYSQLQTSTAEKGVQVPDIRFELANSRRFSARPEQKRNASFTAPGVRIQPRGQSQSQLNKTQIPSQPAQPRTNILKPNTSLNIQERSIQKRQQFPLKEDTLQVTVKTSIVKKPDNVKPADQPVKDVDKTDLKVDSAKEKKSDKKNQNDEGTIVVEAHSDSKGSATKSDRQVVVKTKDASSGDEDSVVVVLNQPRSEQGLERKYGQFFCRRCLRGWSSRSVWCVRHTCKVYIKQTCNACNKLVNPYLVCRLPPVAAGRKERK